MKWLKKKKEVPADPQVAPQKYKIEHHLVSDVYYPMVQKNGSWQWLHDYNPVQSYNFIVTGCKTMAEAELVIKKYHEQEVKTTVVSFDVKINDVLSGKQMERLKKFNELYKTS
jgi:hypothetical protein